MDGKRAGGTGLPCSLQLPVRLQPGPQAVLHAAATHVGAAAGRACVYARRKGCAMVTVPRSGKMRVGSLHRGSARRASGK